MAAMTYKRPESVLVVIYTKDAQVLVLERVHPAGFWQSVTGSLQWGESASAAAQRELEEETGIRQPVIITAIEHRYPILPAWRDRYAPEVNENHEHVFFVELDTAQEVHINPSEHSRYCWLPRQQAADKVTSWSNREAILALVPT